MEVAVYQVRKCYVLHVLPEGGKAENEKRKRERERETEGCPCPCAFFVLLL